MIFLWKLCHFRTDSNEVLSTMLDMARRLVVSHGVLRVHSMASAEMFEWIVVPQFCCSSLVCWAPDWYSQAWNRPCRWWRIVFCRFFDWTAGYCKLQYLGVMPQWRVTKLSLHYPRHSVFKWLSWIMKLTQLHWELRSSRSINATVINTSKIDTIIRRNFHCDDDDDDKGE